MINLLPNPTQLLEIWGYWVIFFSAFLETIPGLGLFIPGQTIVILGGFFAKLHLLNLWKVMIISIMGAIIGDFIGYFIGRIYGYSFFIKYGKYFHFKKEYYEKTKRLMNRHTGVSLIFGRFNSLTRAFAPFVAGSTNVSLPKFSFYNIVGGISWGITFVLIGYLFGESYEIALKYVEFFFATLLIILIIVLYSYYLFQKKRGKKLIKNQ